MIFSDNLSFFYVLAFIVLFNVVKYFTENKNIKNILLVLGSVVVLTTLTNITSLGIIIGLSVAVFFGGKFLSNLEKPKLWQALFIGVLIFLFVLKNYKIADFDLLQRIGLSYILFRLIHFLIESANKKIHTYDLGSFINYIIFFPTFIAGPIDGYNNFDYWAGSTRKSYDQVLFKTGLFKIFIGVVKKFLLVPVIAVYASDFALFDVHYTWQVAFIFSMFLYSFYILLDFSGYSDIAIGTAYLIGVKTPENFDNPYGANNLSTFWKKWHMTFSNFLLKYVFKPTVVNFSKWFPNAPRLTISFIGYVVTFTICGIWHGPTLNFLYWGLWHGVFLYLYKLWDVYVLGKRVKNFSKNKKKVVNAAGLIFTFIVVTTGWVFFNYQTKDLKTLGTNIFHANSKGMSVNTVVLNKSAVFEIQLNPELVKGLDSVRIELHGGKLGIQRFEGIYPEDSGQIFVQPSLAKKTLYEITVIGLRNGNSENIGRQVAYFYNNSFSADGIQELFFTSNIHSKKVELPNAKVCTPVFNLESYLTKGITLSEKYFSGFGWAIDVQHEKHKTYFVDIEYREKGNKKWTIAQRNREAKYGGFQIHGHSKFQTDTRSIPKGTYVVRMRYSNKLSSSSWFYDTIQMENYDNN